VKSGDGFLWTAVGGLLWLALFSLFYTVGDEIGAWPKLPPGIFQNVDLVAGLAGAVTLLAALLIPSPKSKIQSPE
jgi:hypothetical protein